MPAVSAVTLGLGVLAVLAPAAAIVAGAVVGGTAQWLVLDRRRRWSLARRARWTRARARGAVILVVGHLVAAAWWSALLAVFVVVVVPAWFVGRLARRPLAPRHGGAGWSTLDPARRVSDRRATATPLRPPASSPTTVPAVPPSPHRRPASAMTLVGVTAVVLVADVVAGAVLSGTTWLRPPDRGDALVQKQQAAAQAMAMPNIRDEPWAATFGEELAAYQLAAPVYVPYLVSAPHPFAGRFLNVEDGERRSYRPEVPAGVEPLEVAFFGGSTTFGIGQRDEHTIPSAFARQAEAEGIPVVVHNYGFPAWVSWQEHEYFERLLAAGRQFDLVVFYDGFNEFLVQRFEYSRDPTHYGASSLQALASRWHEEHETEPGYLGGPQELVEAYARSSATWRLLRHLTGHDPVPDWQATPSSATPDAQQEAALRIYRRSTNRIRDAAGRAGVPIRSFWQPIEAGWSRSVTDALPAGVVDLSHVLDGREGELYISEVHTNEEGARIVAAAMWDELAPLLRGAAATVPRR